MRKNKKGMAGAVVGLTVSLVLAVILFVAVLIPITNSVVQTAANSSAYLGASYNETNGNSPYFSRSNSFTGTNGAIASNFSTFILIGVLVLIAGVALYGFSRR